MSAEVVFASDERLRGFLRKLAEGRDVWGAKLVDDELHLGLLGDVTEARLGDYRTVEPLKSVFFPPREDLGVWSGSDGPGKRRPALIVGAKACDVVSLAVLDYVFLQGDVVDPYYEGARQGTLLVSSDCTRAKDSCFCTYLGRKPYPEAGFDINLSEVSGGFLVEAGSAKGQKALEDFGSGFVVATDKQLADRDARREEVVKAVEAQVKAAGLSSWEEFAKAFPKKFEAPLWEEEAQKCVECGACNFICPTCHCFLLCELESKEGFRRFKNWDACLYPAFAMVAGGANPRKRRSQRLRNRFDKKFAFFVQHLNSPACTGCGRCTEACAGNIDIKEILRKAS